MAEIEKRRFFWLTSHKTNFLIRADAQPGKTLSQEGRGTFALRLHAGDVRNNIGPVGLITVE